MNSLSAKERNAAETLFKDIWSWEAKGHKPLAGSPSATAGGITSVRSDIPSSFVSISLLLSQLQRWAQHNPPFPTLLVSGSTVTELQQHWMVGTCNSLLLHKFPAWVFPLRQLHEGNCIAIIERIANKDWLPERRVKQGGGGCYAQTLHLNSSHLLVVHPQ